MKKLLNWLSQVAGILILSVINIHASQLTGQWSVFEQEFQATVSGNPYLQVQFSAEFRHGNKLITTDGFYDGNNIFKIRCMPDAPGEWSFVTKSNIKELNNKTGTFTCVKSDPSVHGPVHVRDTFNFGYADGTPYYPVGTTCYQWVFQGNPEQTLETLSNHAFNKIRMCVFPTNMNI
jgi:hypothetical protein